MSLLVFNPDNDMALADNRPGFTPPAHIQVMSEELKDLLCGIVPETDEIQVWGWSPAIVHRLKKDGVSEELLPTRQELARMRDLSSRQTAVQLLAEIRQAIPDEQLTGMSRFCTTEQQIRDALDEWGECILKAPWSSSGKGIRYSRKADGLEGWCRRLLHQQGGIAVEPLYPKTADLAMEFYSDGKGQVIYQGLSLFTTHDTGAYSGNIVCPEEEKMQWLNRHIPQALTDRLIKWYEHRLGTLINTQYRGYLGVDMILVGSKLHPCIEMNLRMTMGMLSILIMRKQKEGYHGEFRLEYSPNQQLVPGATLLAGGKNYKAFLIEK